MTFGRKVIERTATARTLRDTRVLVFQRDRVDALEGVGRQAASVMCETIARVLALHLLMLAALDAEQVVHGETDLAAAGEVGFEELVRVIEVFALFLGVRVQEGAFHLVAEGLEGRTGEGMDLLGFTTGQIVGGAAMASSVTVGALVITDLLGDANPGG